MSEIKSAVPYIPILVDCPYCREKHEIEEDEIGRDIECYECCLIFHINDPDEKE